MASVKLTASAPTLRAPSGAAKVARSKVSARMAVDARGRRDQVRGQTKTAQGAAQAGEVHFFALGREGLDGSQAPSLRPTASTVIVSPSRVIV